MPLIDSDASPTHGPRVAVRPSVATELEWALASAEFEDYRRDHPSLAAVYDRHPELQERICGLWGPDESVACGGFMELMVLAHQGGLLFTTDAELLLERLDGLCRQLPHSPVGFGMLSETSEDRAALLRRLERLRSSDQFRQQYLGVVRAMWDAIRPDWELYGRGSVEVAVTARRRLGERGADWHEVVRSECDFGDLLDQTVGALGPDGELVVVPAFFTHKGLLLDLPGMVVVGVRTDITGAQARARTEAVAHRLKAISDPTRLAMLDALRGGPRTVTEIANAFQLAQPTVSNHVKVLRDAGLLADERQGARRNLVVQGHRVEELLDTLHDLLSARDLPDRAVGV